MKKSILILITVLSGFAVSAATIIPHCARSQVTIYNAPLGALEHSFVPMSFGKSKTSGKSADVIPANAEIIAVDIVYTDFPKGQSFDDLNEKRAQALLTSYPDLASNHAVSWNLVAQTNCDSKQEAEALFHGVVVHYRIPPSPESIMKEISFLKTVGKSGASKPTKDFASSMGGSTVSESTTARISRAKEGEITEESLTVGGITYAFSDAAASFHPNTLVIGTDSTLMRVFNRNKWVDMTIAADITGSMSPYTAQLLVWLSLNFNDKKVKQITFFNDGDAKRDAEKKIGQIGGIYQTTTNDIEAVRKVATKAMMGGCGGDGPENNIEGLLRAYDKTPNCKELVLVADALAPVKDIRLLDQIKVPVRVILCGTYYGVSPDYLLIASKTGGSVHTMEEDLQNLASLKEGETVRLGRLTFRISKGAFVQIR